MVVEGVGIVRHDGDEATRQVLTDYFAAFASGDLDAVREHLHEDFHFDRGTWPPLRGAQEFESFYRELWRRGSEAIDVESMSWRSPMMRVSLVVDLRMHHGWADFPGGGLAAGQRVQARSHLDYLVVDGQVRAIIDRTDAVIDGSEGL